jgi:hypothetical protein
MERPPPHFNGKEGVNGSSPLEGSTKAPHSGAFLLNSTCRFLLDARLWSPLWSLQVENYEKDAPVMVSRLSAFGSEARTDAIATVDRRRRG